MLPWNNYGFLEQNKILYILFEPCIIGHASAAAILVTLRSFWRVLAPG